MKKHGFLQTLSREGKLALVDPSDTIRESYRQKSVGYLESALILLESGHIEQSVSMSYYSMYYSVLALFFACGIKCENHTAAIVLLKEIFGIDNASLREAKSERIDKQYYVASAPVRSEAESLARTAETFNAELLDATARLTGTKVAAYRKKFSELI